MHISRAEKERAIEENLAAFLDRLPELLRSNRGKTALLRDREIAGIYDTIIEAQMTGLQLFPDQKFSVQEITDEAIDLGIYSHAMHLG